MGRFAVHNAREELGYESDIWLVIDTDDGTAVSQNPDRQDAENDWVLLTAFYNRWPGSAAMDSAVIPLGLAGSPAQFQRGHWKGRHLAPET